MAITPWAAPAALSRLVIWRKPHAIALKVRWVIAWLTAVPLTDATQAQIVGFRLCKVFNIIKE